MTDTQSLKPVVDEFCNLLVLFHNITVEAIDDSNSPEESSAILALERNIIIQTFETLKSGIRTMQDEEMRSLLGQASITVLPSKIAFSTTKKRKKF
jgi:hypothetical protein